MAVVGVKDFLIASGVRPGHDWKFPFFTAFVNVANVGENAAV